MLCDVIVARALTALLALSALLVGCGSSSRSHSASALSPIGAGLQGMNGLVASQYASGVPNLAALVRGPDGRLWAAAAGLGEHAHDGVYVIPPSGGVAHRVISGLDDPLGLLWLGGRLYVASVGRVTAYSDFDGARFRHATTVLRGPVPRGENNAMALGRDGRLRMGITATCDHCVPRSPFSGAIVSFRPDGSGLRVYASRIRAPVGLAFLPGTTQLLASLNQRNDLGARTTGDALALVPPGSDWRFPGCYQQGGPACAGVPAPVAVLDKHAAVGPIVVVGGALGAGTTSALVTEWQTGKVVRVALSGRGGRLTGTPLTGTPSTWLTGLHDPFALWLDGPRSLLVGDWSTGRVYRVGVR